MSPVVHLFHGCHRAQRPMTGPLNQIKLCYSAARSIQATLERRDTHAPLNCFKTLHNLWQHFQWSKNVPHPCFVTGLKTFTDHFAVQNGESRFTFMVRVCGPKAHSAGFLLTGNVRPATLSFVSLQFISTQNMFFLAWAGWLWHPPHSHQILWETLQCSKLVFYNVPGQKLPLMLLTLNSLKSIWGI